MATQLHQGHRARLRERAAVYGINALEPHEQVELLLFNCLRRRNVNPLAHRLIDRFGSLAGICAASEKALLEVEGVGRKTAQFLRDIPVTSEIYLAAMPTRAKAYTRADIEALLVTRLSGAKEEQLMLLCFNGRMELIAAKTVARGTPASVGASARSIVGDAMQSGAVAAVLGHSHPGGHPLPSDEDRYFTRHVSDALAGVDVRLIEHYIVADGLIRPMLATEGEG